MTQVLERAEVHTLDALKSAGQVRLYARRSSHAAPRARRARVLYHMNRLAVTMAESMRLLRRANNTGLIDQLSDAAFATLTNDLERLYRSTRAGMGFLKSHGLREDLGTQAEPLLAQIEEQTDELRDLVETFRLAADPGFQRLARAAVAKLPAP